MPISNGTTERVGVEVSGPDSGITEKKGKKIVAAGGVVALAGLVLHNPLVAIAGFLTASVGGVVLWRARREKKKHVEPVALWTTTSESLPILTLLEPHGELPDPDTFNNLMVTFYKPAEKEIRGEKIAEIDFNDVDYTIRYYGSATDLITETKPLQTIKEPVQIALHQLRSMQYEVSVAAAA